MIEIVLNNEEGYKYDGLLDCLLDELNQCESKYLELLRVDHVIGIPYSQLGMFKQTDNNKVEIEFL